MDQGFLWKSFLFFNLNSKNQMKSSLCWYILPIFVFILYFQSNLFSILYLFGFTSGVSFVFVFFSHHVSFFRVYGGEIKILALIFILLSLFFSFPSPSKTIINITTTRKKIIYSSMLRAKERKRAPMYLCIIIDAISLYYYGCTVFCC